jgi:hypothetical protein
MRGRILASLGAAFAVMTVFASMVTLAVTAVPAQAWSYCTNAVSYPDRLNWYGEQGYCGPSGRSNLNNYAPGQCVDMGGYDGFPGSVWNRTGINLVLHSGENCTGTWKPLAANTSDPNLYDDGLYHNISSFRMGGW